MAESRFRLSCALIAVIAAANSQGISAAPFDLGVSVQLAPVVRITADQEKGDATTPMWLYADPADGRHLIVCSRMGFRQGVSRGYVYASADAGATWRRTLVHGPAEMKWVSEEACTFGDHGIAYFADSSVPELSEKEQEGLFNIFVSHNYGITWRSMAKWQGYVDWPFLLSAPDDRGSPCVQVFANAILTKGGRVPDEGHPIAFDTCEGRDTLSDPMIATNTSFVSFAGGAVALPSKSALFIAPAWPHPNFGAGVFIPFVKAHYQMEVYSLSRGDHTLRPHSSVHDEYGRILTAPALQQDVSGGRFQGRLYAAWVESGARDTVWLATSNDSGDRWSTRRIFSGMSEGPSLAEARMAITPSGTLGISWIENGETLVFVVSEDGGETFDRLTSVATRKNANLDLVGSVPFNEYFLERAMAANNDKSQDGLTDAAHLGLSVRVGHRPGVWPVVALAADAQNVFHIVWGQEQTGGTHALFTRAMRVDPQTNASSASSAKGHFPNASESPNYSLHNELAGPGLAEAREINDPMSLEIRSVTYSNETRTVDAAIALVNKSQATLPGPLFILAADLHSDIGVPTALNAAGSVAGYPYWNVAPLKPGALQARGKSKPLRLRFKIGHFRAFAPRYYGDAVAMRLFVYRKASQ